MMLNNALITPRERLRSSRNNILRTPSNNNGHMDENAISIHGAAKSEKNSSTSFMKNAGRSKPSTKLRTRRALGDISNRDGAGSNSISKHPSHTDVIFKKSSAPISNIKIAKSVTFGSTQIANTRNVKSKKIRQTGIQNSKTPRSSAHKSSQLKSKTETKISKVAPTQDIRGTSFKPIHFPSKLSASQIQPKQIREAPKSEATKHLQDVEPVEDIELPAGRMWDEEEARIERNSPRNSPPSFTLDGCTDFIPFMRINEIRMQEEEKNRIGEEKLQRKLDSALKQNESVIFIDGNEDFIQDEGVDEISEDHDWMREMKEQMMFELDDLSI